MMARNIAGHKINYKILDIRNNRLTLQVINCMLHDLQLCIIMYDRRDQSSIYVCMQVYYIYLRTKTIYIAVCIIRACVCVLRVLHIYACARIDGMMCA